MKKGERHPKRNYERDAEILRLRDSGMIYREIAARYGLSVERIVGLVHRGKRERGDEMPVPRHRIPKPLTEEEKRIREAAAVYYASLRYGRVIDNSHIEFPPCQLCNGTGIYDEEPCPDCTEQDDGQPTERDEWNDYDKDC